MHISEKIVAAMVVWTIPALVASYLIGQMLQVFIILEFIGLLVIYGILELFTPSEIKRRVEGFVFIGILVFFAIVMRKILIVLEFI